MKKVKNKAKNVFNKRLPIGQTLETSDIYLKYNKKTSNSLKSSRPVIIAGKLVNPKGQEEYLIIPASRENTKNTSWYGKHGIKYYRHNIEILDDEDKPIMQNNKFRKTKNSTILPMEDIKHITNKVVNHSKFSSENRKKQNKFLNRYKKR